MSKETFCLEVAGDYACFTRPEMKVERVSYDVITPSAARGIFEAILWKPAIRWNINKIELLRPVNWVNIRAGDVDNTAGEEPLSPIRWVNMRRNELSEVASQKKEQIWIEDNRQQRAGLFLRDVAYRLHARFDLLDDSRHVHNYPHLQCADSTENSYPKFAEIFKRRASKGQCFNQPYLGTREFSASFRLIESDKVRHEQKRRPAAAEETRDLGWMLYDMDYRNSDKPMPRFYNAKIEKGVIKVPAWNSDEVRG